MTENMPKMSPLENGEPRFVVHEVLTVFGVICAFAIVLIYYPDLPDKIPTHFDISGKPDGWGSKEMAWLFPGITLFLYGLMKLSLWMVGKHPDKTNAKDYNPEQLRLTKKFLVWLNLELVWLFVVLDYLSIRVALERTEGLGVWALPVFLIVVLGTVILFVTQIIKAR